MNTLNILDKHKQIEESAVYNYFPLFCKAIFNLPLQEFHKEIFKFIEHRLKSLINAPRGFGKSTYFTQLYSIWQVVRNRNIRIAIVSNTDTQARAFLRPISHNLKHNVNLISTFGSFYDNSLTWTDNELLISNRNINEKEATISVFGVQSDRIVGKHFDIIICDDIIDLENSRTELQREKIKEWFYQVLMPTLMENGKIIIIGTRYNPNDLYNHFITNEYKNNFCVYRAINEVNGIETSLWEERFPIAELKQIQKDMGRIRFSAQYQNDASLMSEANLIHPENIQYYSNIDFTSDFRFIQTIDLATGVQDGDYSVAMMTAYNYKTKEIYVDDVIIIRTTIKAFKEMIKNQFEKYKKHYPVSYCEANGFQTSILQDINDTFKNMRIKPIKNTVNKFSRFVGALSPVFDDRKVFLNGNCRNMALLETQLLALTPTGSSTNDDASDALCMAIEKLPRTQTQSIRIK